MSTKLFIVSLLFANVVLSAAYSENHADEGSSDARQNELAKTEAEPEVANSDAMHSSIVWPIHDPKPTQYPAVVTPNRGTPDASEISTALDFSENPSDVDIFMARVFEEPLVPTGGETAQADENRDLANALTAYKNQADRENVDVLTSFLAAHPQSRWTASLNLSLGLLYRGQGHFSNAMECFDRAWNLSKNETEGTAYAMANRSVGELADLNARFGRYEQMKKIFDETDRRDIPGSAQTKLVGAKEGYWRMTERPAEGFRCGPYAVNAVLGAIQNKYIPNPVIAKEPSTKKGTSLKQIKNLSDRVGLSYEAAVRSDGGKWIIPSVIHLKVGHFAAITKKVKGRYLLEDPTFGSELWVDEKALDLEASGYALIPKNKLNSGWTSVSNDVAETVWGKGGSDSANEDCKKCEDDKSGGSGDSGCGGCGSGGSGGGAPMATYSIFSMLATLHISDNPVRYSPPSGPAINFTVTYNHLESRQPSNMQFMNFGPFWTTSWTSYITIDSSSNAIMTLRGGGTEVFNYSQFNSVLKQYPPTVSSQTTLNKVGDLRYEHVQSDGTREVYATPDGTGRIFLSQVIDPHGDVVSLQYDASFRLIRIYDALGKYTEIAYKSNVAGSAGYYKVYTVTDPFGRFAEFTYDSSLTKLVKIRDIIGIESQFAYSEDGFISKLTTPYGVTSFSQYVPTQDGAGRGLMAVLPNGSKEVVERYLGHEMMTYYWNREAMMNHPGERDYAQQTKWLMSAAGQVMEGIPTWKKKALESPVYYTYSDEPPGTPSPNPEEEGVLHYHVGTSDQPSTIRRTLDDNSEQIYRCVYNRLGNITKFVDPSQRVTSYVYAANDQDLLEVRQTTNGINDLIAKYTYNGHHERTSEMDASGGVTSYEYNSRGQIAAITNAKGEIKTFVYDGDGQLVEINGFLPGNGDRVEYTYDSYGRVYTKTIFQGPDLSDRYTVTYTYDAMDRVTRTTFPDGSYEQADYSRLDAIRKRDRDGRWTHYGYDSMQKLVEMRTPDNAVTKYDWCICGAFRAIVDALGNRTGFSYDEQGRLIKKSYADGTDVRFSYEQRISRLRTVTDARGTVASYVYKIDNAIASVDYVPGDGVPATAGVVFTYDEKYPRISSVGNDYGTYFYRYKDYTSDPFASPSAGRGMISSIENSALSGSDVSYAYDELGRQIKREVGSSNVLLKNYDSAGRLVDYSNNLGTFAPEYSNSTFGGNRPNRINYPNGMSVRYDWEAGLGDFALKQIKGVNSVSESISQFDYEVDRAGLVNLWRQQKADEVAREYKFEYDDSYQLTSAVLSDVATHDVVKQYAYSYDALGNRVSEQVGNLLGASAYNMLNQIASQGSGGLALFRGTINEPGKVVVNGEPAKMSGGTNFVARVPVVHGTNTISVVASDVNNNVRTNSYQVPIQGRDINSFTYDLYGNMLADEGASYSWDACNRLIKITYSTGGWSELAYDAFNRMVRIVEKSSLGEVTDVRRFVYDGMEIVERRGAANEIIRQYYRNGFRDVITDSNYYYTRDHLGSIREVVASDGQTVVCRYDYDPFGRFVKISGDEDSDFTFTGLFNHQRSGLLFACFRQYNPEIGRWISRDPIAEKGGLNIYSYVRNNPIALTDLSGLKWTQEGPGKFFGGVGWNLSSFNFDISGAGAMSAMVYGVTGKWSAVVQVICVCNGARKARQGVKEASTYQGSTGISIVTNNPMPINVPSPSSIKGAFGDVVAGLLDSAFPNNPADGSENPTSALGSLVSELASVPPSGPDEGEWKDGNPCDKL